MTFRLFMCLHAYVRTVTWWDPCGLKIPGKRDPVHTLDLFLFDCIKHEMIDLQMPSTCMNRSSVQRVKGKHLSHQHSLAYPQCRVVSYYARTASSDRIYSDLFFRNKFTFLDLKSSPEISFTNLFKIKFNLRSDIFFSLKRGWRFKETGLNQILGNSGLFLWAKEKTVKWVFFCSQLAWRGRKYA